ncbi:DUF4336 domain-containing protein [Bradyrhizobium sp. SYSU BS000235]|uniref:DUF4336 domain-containing protein n=1 Tax=Bradyrhizobium sp. SYSU BS000235 TaxID=3411332 RepID=UPI003C73A24D
MTAPAYQLYEPLGQLKCVADDVWIVDGPEIHFRYFFLRIPFPTRMTVVRLPAGEVWIHSPVALTDELVSQITRIGPVRHLVAPNTLHYWWVGEWKQRFPDAQVWAVSRLDPGAKDRVPPHTVLNDEPPPAWNGVLDQVIVEGSRLMEADFFHRPSRTLLLTDMIENFEKERVASRFYRWLFRVGGVIDPDGMTPSDLKPTFAKRRDELRAAVKQMIAWQPERLILAHGRWYPCNAVAELQRSFRWVL